MAERATSIVIADGHEFQRNTIALWLTHELGFEVKASVGDGVAAWEAIGTHKPQLAWLDIAIPGRSALSIADEIRKDGITTRCVFTVGVERDREIADVITAKGAGIMTLSDTSQEISQVLKTVAEGGTAHTPKVVTRLAALKEGKTDIKTRSTELTHRELEVLRYVARGLSKRAVSELMFISPRTVERHVANIMETLDIHDRVDLTRFAIREGLVEP